jgi:hypothetical protein
LYESESFNVIVNELQLLKNLYIVKKKVFDNEPETETGRLF